MYQKIMVPLDGSPLAETAIDAAAEIAQHRGSKIYLVRAFEPTLLPPIAAGFVDREELYNQEHKVIEDYLKSKVHETIPTETVVLEGSGPNPLIQWADESDMELIVMTSHGRTGFENWVFGSIAEKIVRHSPCPVLTIGPKTLRKFADRLGINADPVD